MKVYYMMFYNSFSICPSYTMNWNQVSLPLLIALLSPCVANNKYDQTRAPKIPRNAHTFAGFSFSYTK